jgi:N-acetylmuramic acid 6-phosphate etherase
MKYCIAIDGGGTKTRAGLYDADGNLLKEAEGKASNISRTGPSNATHTVGNLINAMDVSALDIIVGGFAGVDSWDLKQTIGESLYERFKPSKVVISNDLIPIKLAHVGRDAGIVGVAGTGSCVWAENEAGEYSKKGGFGSVLGDPCSGYTMVVETIRGLLYQYELNAGLHNKLAEQLIEAAQVDSFRSFVPWLQQQEKSVVAELFPIIVRDAEEGDEFTQAFFQTQPHRFVTSIRSAQHDLDLPRDVTTILAGGIFEHCDYMFNLVADAIREANAVANVVQASITGHQASWHLAAVEDSSDAIFVLRRSNGRTTHLPPTESMSVERGLDSMNSLEIVTAMEEHNQEAAQAVGLVKHDIAKAMEASSKSFDNGGRLIYLGAGTSGRLGVLDASECPPTFGVSDWAIGIMAGGDTALRNSVEGAEDDPEQSIADLKALDPPVNPNDFVVGITASGTATYVLSALTHSKTLGAKTALVCCNSVPSDTAEIIISIPTGPEILPGSTRLKAGTATKMVLNMITTGAMALSNHIYEGYMVGMRPVNAKLRGRAIRIVSELTQLDAGESEKLLDETNGCIKTAVIMNKRDIPNEEAKSLLDVHEGKLRNALES